MSYTVTANDRIIEWNEDLTLSDVFTSLGYRIDPPPVLVRVNGELIRKALWKSCRLTAGARIQIVNILQGG
jgi:thiamine biosynthesis protein ThiS